MAAVETDCMTVTVASSFSVCKHQHPNLNNDPYRYIVILVSVAVACVNIMLCLFFGVMFLWFFSFVLVPWLFH